MTNTQELDTINADLELLFKEKETLDTRIRTLCQRRETLRESIDLSRGDQFTLAELMADAPSATSHVSRLLDQWGKRFFLSFSGYLIESRQHFPRITVYQDDTDAILEIMAEGIMKLVEVLEPISVRLGTARMFDIFEHTLSAGGSWTLQYDGSTWTTCRGRRIDQSYSTLMAALRRIRSDHFYDSNRPKVS